MKLFSTGCFLLATGLLLITCKPGKERPSSIRDFTETLQPYLIRAVATGIVGDDSATVYIQTHATDKELTLLSHSEHPILRAVAFREMLVRRSFDHFQLILNHLDDTARVTRDRGEFGVDHMTISDDILEYARWKSIDDRNKTAEQVLVKHNHLRSAFSVLRCVNLLNKYYEPIRAMASRDDWFEDREFALYALAWFKKKEDIPFIKDILTTNAHKMTERSMSLMGDFPDTAYMPVLKYWFRRKFYHSVRYDGYLGLADKFIDVLASYKSDSSAKILQAMLNQKPFLPCVTDTFSLRSTIVFAIWNNACPAYSKLRQQTKKDFERYKPWFLHLDIPVTARKHTNFEPISWLSEE
jgi:hypothetical protein